jgi:predicted nuclease of predicted toxin-antitoxin system
MWLLDVNVPSKVAAFLSRRGIVCVRTDRQGWSHLKNSELVEAAVQQGFQCLLTRDKMFGESAARSLRRHPKFAVVLLSLRQAKELEYLAEFEKRWAKSVIQPQPGNMTIWPEG